MNNPNARSFFRLVLIIILVLGTFGVTQESVRANRPQETAAAVTVVAEGNDFATRVLKDPWDMNEYTDISQNINSDGNTINLLDINVSDGIFSAKAVDGQGGEGFYVLFPGFNETIPAGKAGGRFPINSSLYKCLYVAMKVQSVAGVPEKGEDQYKVFWFADQMVTSGVWGEKATPIYNTGTETPVHYWKLFKLDLSQGSVLAGEPYTSRSTWQGLRIDPTNQANIPFEVDWVRLTDCAAVNHTVRWETPNSSVYIWARPEGTTRNILIAENLSGNEAALDLQGLDAGTYELFLSTSKTSCCTKSLSIVNVNRSPVVKFTKPSFTSGPLYGDEAGVYWDMDGETDFDWIICATYSISNGILILDTPSVGDQPPACVGGDVSDPRIQLHSSTVINTKEYRYLTYRIKGENEPGKNWQEFGQGMMVRWIWKSGSCYLVSQAIAYDVGWNTYTVDLWDPFGGSVVQKVGTCPSEMISWRSSGSASEFRFDPNENISGHNFHQEIDWIMLAKVDQVKRGQNFNIRFMLNKDTSGVSYVFYYTTDPVSSPKQHLAVIKEHGPVAAPPVEGPFKYFLPAIMNKHDPSIIESGYLWDTTNVATGDYYICAEASDGVNTVISCSEAPVKVVQ